MLQKIPPSPEYGTWMKILSAVYSVLPLTSGARVLNAWSPEKRDGEYAEKHKHRLKEIGIGTLVLLAKEHGWAGNRTKHSGRVIVRHQLSPSHRNSTPLWVQRIKQTQQHPKLAKPHQPTAGIDLEEAHRIAKELLKLHDAGLIAEETDADARFFARVAHLFRGTFTC